MSLLAGALRGAIIATPGQQLYVADYNAIEARVLLWLAGDEDALEIFRSGRDIYLEMAESIYGRPCYKGTPERQLGKVAILGLGFQMGASRFVDAALTMGGVTITETEAKRAVEVYREKYWRVRQLWQNMQAAAMSPCLDGRPAYCGDTTWLTEGRFLYCELPSGRRLAYPDPEVQMKETSWGEKRPTLTFMGVNTHTRKWGRQTTYGGMLVENVTQACARDIMAAAMLRLEDGDVYKPVLSVHDEVIAEGPLDGSIDEFVNELTSLPDWADGLPIVAEGWAGPRYHK